MSAINRSIIALLLCPVLVHAQECVLQDRTVNSVKITIQERSGIQTHVAPSPTGGSRCIVNFKARVGSRWLWASGQYDWDDQRPHSEGCAVAVARAEESLQQQANPSHVVSEKILVCSDDSTLKTIVSTNLGTVGKLHQFRPHPNFQKRFWHNGTQCRWFVDSTFKGGDIYTYQGIICQVGDNEWVVVDKF